MQPKMRYQIPKYKARTATLTTVEVGRCRREALLGTQVPLQNHPLEVDSNLWFRLEGTFPCIFGCFETSRFCNKKMAHVTWFL